jgi:hypothetical protein
MGQRGTFAPVSVRSVAALILVHIFTWVGWASVTGGRSGCDEKGVI